jgi:hypothetical protein
MRYLQLGIASLVLASSTSASTTRQIFNFSTYVDIENSHLRPNGNLLLSTFSNASLFEINPSASNPQAKLVDELPGATALCGIASIGYDKFAVIGGIRGNYSYTNETVYIVDYSKNTAEPAISIAASLPNAIMLNGADSLSTYPEIVLTGDARQGYIFRVNTTSGDSEIAIQDEALAPPSNASVPIGVNGLKVFDGYVYYTNTARNTFGRVPITEAGLQNGDVEVISQLDPGAYAYDWDDFILDAAGSAYVAQPPSAIGRILPDGENGIFIGGGNNTTIFNPTSLSLTKDGKTAYVTTRGGIIGDYEYSGAVIEMKL